MLQQSPWLEVALRRTFTEQRRNSQRRAIGAVSCANLMYGTTE